MRLKALSGLKDLEACQGGVLVGGIFGPLLMTRTQNKAQPLGIVEDLQILPKGCVGAGDGPIYGFFCSYLLDYLRASGVTNKQLQRGGLTIKTTMDPKATKAAKLSAEQVSQVWEFVKSKLNPHPAHGFSSTNSRDRDTRQMYILPDVIITRGEHGLEGRIPLVHGLREVGRAPVAPRGAGHDLAERTERLCAFPVEGPHLRHQPGERVLALPRSQVFVAPSRTPADPLLIAHAIRVRARVVSNDRFRDWREEFPALGDRGFLVPGRLRGGEVELRLE